MRKLSRDSLAMVLLLGCIAGLGPLATDMYLASLPALTGIFSTDTGSVQLTLSAYMVSFALTQLFFGPLSDRYGRRPLLLAGMGLFVVASLGCALSQSIEALVFWRAVQGMGACGGVVMGRAVVRDLFERDRAARMMSMIAMALGVTPAIAPVLGGYLHFHLGWESNFFAMALLGLMLCLAIALLLAESNTRPDPTATRPGPILRNFATLLRHRSYRGHVACVAFCYGGLFTFISASSFVLIRVFGVSETLYGYCFALIVVGYISGAMIGTRLTLRLGSERMLRWGAGLCAFGGSLMAIISLIDNAQGPGSLHWFSVVGPMMVYMVGLGLTLPQGQAGGMQPFPAMAGAAASLMGFAQMTLGAVVGILVGHSLGGTALPLTLTIAAMGWLTFAAYWLVVRPARPA